jgi:hypothetical protein
MGRRINRYSLPCICEYSVYLDLTAESFITLYLFWLSVTQFNDVFYLFLYSSIACLVFAICTTYLPIYLSSERF